MRVEKLNRPSLRANSTHELIPFFMLISLAIYIDPEMDTRAAFRRHRKSYPAITTPDNMPKDINP